jgi:hypothetical protein
MSKIVGFVIVFVITMFLFGCNKGIVTLEGYPEAVAFCGYDMVLNFDGSTTIQRDGIHLVVNDGHLKDREVKLLFEKAKVECAKLK